MHKSIISILVSIALGAAAIPLAMAESVTPAANMSGSHFEQRHQRDRRAFSLPGERIEARLAYLKTALKITAAQEPQWTAFANVLRKHARERDQRILARRARRAECAEFSRMTAVERLQRRQEGLTMAAQRVKELLAVEKPLYASLMPEQKQIADEIFARRLRGKFLKRRMLRGA